MRGRSVKLGTGNGILFWILATPVRRKHTKDSGLATEMLLLR
jgi:hypothetical protein